MKSLIRNLFAICALAILSTSASASVFESNYTSGYIKKVVMRSTVDGMGCSYYYTFTCEHYLNYGESMAYQDFDTSSGDCVLHYYYWVDSITWIPVETPATLPGQIAPGLTIGSDLKLYNSSGWAISGFQGLIMPNHSPDCITLSYNRPWFDDQYAALRGRPLTTYDREQLDRGCIGVAAAECSVKTGVVVYGEDQRIYLGNIEANNDSRFGEVHAFRTLIDAQNYSCTNGGRKVIIAKVGVWATNYRPNGPANIPGGQPGEIPLNSVDGELYASITPPSVITNIQLCNFSCWEMGTYEHVVEGCEFQEHCAGGGYRRQAAHRTFRQANDVRRPMSTSGQLRDNVCGMFIKLHYI